MSQNHENRVSDSSLYDTVCIHCGTIDVSEAEPCLARTRAVPGQRAPYRGPRARLMGQIRMEDLLDED